MPTTTISSDIISTDPVAVDLIADEDLVILAGVLVSTSGGIGVQADTGGSHDVAVQGTIEATTGILFNDSFGSVSIASTGSIDGGEIGIFVRGSTTETFNFSNDGDLAGNTTGIAAIFDGEFIGTNTGTITSQEGDAVAIGVRSGGTFTNTGLIETFSTDSNAVDIFFTGSGGPVATFINNGTIRSNGDDALDMDSNDSNRAFNFGTIDGGVLMGSENDFFRQRGILNGDVDLGAGNDRFLGGTGVMTGTVFAGAGNDRVIGGSSEDLLQGEGGADFMRGNNGRDTIFGGFGQDNIRGDNFNDVIGGGGGRDELRGGSGGDVMYGGSEADLMFGQAGRDNMFGGTGDDTISGGSQKDRIDGGAGDDEIYGGDARDTITGGLGEDLIRGGAGQDTFVWNSVAESDSMATRDRIFDFGFFGETLDFSGVTGPALTYRFQQAFTGTGNGELRIVENQFGNTLVQIDVDGDAVMDMVVQVNGLGLGIDNFIF